MSEKKFSKKHEWVSIEGDTATVGITKHATELLGDIVFVEVPEAGKAVEKDGQIIAERREVQIGARRKGEVEILEGLVSGDLVVTHGTLKARDGSALNVLAVEENNETLVELIELHEVTDDTQANASAARKAEALL